MTGGACSLYAKRLEKGRFIWPSQADGVVGISASQLAYMRRIDDDEGHYKNVP